MGASVRSGSIRPTFALPVHDAAALWRELDRELEERPGDCIGTVFRRHAVLRFRRRVSHFWSPHLYLELREDEEAEPGCPPAVRLHGRFAPHPHVWTLFLAIYLLLSFSAIAAAVWGFSVWRLGDAPWVLVGIPAALLVQVVVYAAAMVGQRLGEPQMRELRALVDTVCARVDADLDFD